MPATAPPGGSDTHDEDQREELEGEPAHTRNGKRQLHSLAERHVRDESPSDPVPPQAELLGFDGWLHPAMVALTEVQSKSRGGKRGGTLSDRYDEYGDVVPGLSRVTETGR